MVFDGNLSLKVYDLLKKIPRGKVTTYSEIAKVLGNMNLARAVGNTLNRNPDLVSVPCYRVVRSDGSVGGYKLGCGKKIELLESEGVEIKDGRIDCLEAYLFCFKGQ
ncbi:methylated-DNA--[protein]-cysteine S-methyltransferase [archaeon]|nr:methylated-DNA--[protein]-cysteine S-methyltransferase [archaeon]